MKPIFIFKSKIKRIIELFEEPPEDSDVHEVADSLGMNPDKFEEVIYSVLSTFIGGGKFKESGLKESDFNPKEIEAGIKIEMEHINPKSPYAKLFAKRITLDHLAEAKEWKTPKYYTGPMGLLAWEEANKKGEDELEEEEKREQMKNEGKEVPGLGGGRPEQTFERKE